MARRESNVDQLLAVASPRNRRTAALMDMLLYERALEMGAVTPSPQPLDAKGLRALLCRAMTTHTGLNPSVPVALSVMTDNQALLHAFTIIGRHFKTDKPLAVQANVVDGHLRIQCKSSAPRAIIDEAILRTQLVKPLSILNAKLDLDPLTPSTLAVLLPLAPGRPLSAGK